MEECYYWNNNISRIGERNMDKKFMFLWSSVGILMLFTFLIYKYEINRVVGITIWIITLIMMVISWISLIIEKRRR